MTVITYQEKDFPEHVAKLKRLYMDLFAGGKGFRARLVNLVASNLELSKEQQICLQTVIEYIHNSSLLHDDLIDQSHLRRGKTAAWLEYGADHAVLAGDYLLAKVIALLCEQGNLKLVSYTANVIMELVEGEWHQDDLKTRTEIESEDLLKVHELKTASLKKWGLRAPFYLAGREEESLHRCLEEIGRLMGVIFQRSDDLIDYNVRNYEDKAILGDHKGAYLNSFANFLLEEESESYKSEFLKQKDLEQIHNFVGKAKWEKTIEKFDQCNQAYIDLYNEEILKLSKMLKESESQIIVNLAPLGHLIYWRK